MTRYKRPTRFTLDVPHLEATFLNMVWDDNGVRVSVPDPKGGKYKLWICLPIEWVKELPNA